MPSNDIIIIKFRLSTVLGCFIAAIGYGAGYSLPYRLGYSPIVCIIACLILGALFDFLSTKLFESKIFSSSKRNMVIFTVAVYAVYLTSRYFVLKQLNYDIDEEFLSDVGLMVLFEMFSFVLNYFKHLLHKRKN